jgi:beta-N-acetylhexosaminidase
MVALATYTHLDPERLAVFSPTVIRGILRTELGFDGLVISDDLGATAAVAEIPEGDRAVDFLAAGGDVVISKTVDAAAAMYEGVLARADVDAGFRQLVDVAALRVLTAKAVSGLVPGCSGG